MEVMEVMCFLSTSNIVNTMNNIYFIKISNPQEFKKIVKFFNSKCVKTHINHVSGFIIFDSKKLIAYSHPTWVDSYELYSLYEEIKYDDFKDLEMIIDATKLGLL
jgi:hypothetical protein